MRAPSIVTPVLVSMSVLIVNASNMLRSSSQNQPLPVATADEAEVISRFNSAVVDPVSNLDTEEPDRKLIVSGGCMEDNYGGNLGCTANDIGFLRVANFTVLDEGATKDPDTGVWEGACRGIDDYVTVTFNFDFEVRGDRYDLGMYVNTEGGNAMTGTCTVARMTNGTFSGATIDEIEDVPDNCWDVTKSGDGMMLNYPFEKMTLKCADTKDNSGNSDGLLDFDIAITWTQSEGTECDIDDPTKQPVPGAPSKCWYDANSRVTLDIVVPPYNSPSAMPSESPTDSPTTSPSLSSAPSSNPSGQPSVSFSPSTQPSESPSLSLKPTISPTTAPSISSQPSSTPSESPSVSFAPSDVPSSKPSLSTEPSSAPSESPSVSFAPSSTPSDQPSISTQPSKAPTTQPSLSTQPSSTPSEQPSISTQPSSTPSLAPSTSAEPTSTPSESPSVSFAPSTQPSDQPSLSTQPSMSPTTAPSVSSAPSSTTESPSDQPSVSHQPSISTAPSKHPTSQPSLSTEPSVAPSSQPSDSPTISTQPTSVPSLAPSTSSAPSISTAPSDSPTGAPSVSSAPSFTTMSPSDAPSISQAPSISPSASPTISSAPTNPPSVSPSAAPSNQPTEGYYYPDWINENQVCTNDGLDPEYMLEVQRNNYLYRSKEDCCRNHFWWRITQCMANEHPMFYSDGSKCDQKVFFEDWEHNSPAEWSKTKLFETLDECCIDNFWFDYAGCMGDSVKEMEFAFSVDINELIEPTFCQDADTIANAIGVAMNVGLGSDSYADVTQLGSITLSRDDFTGNTICGGSLEGATFLGDFDGTRDPLPDATGIVTSVSGVVTTKSDCIDADCFSTLYDDIITSFATFVSSGALTLEIQSWARERLPPVKQLYDVSVSTTSFEYEQATNPYVITADSKTGLEVTTGGSFEVKMDMSTITTVAELQAFADLFEAQITSTLSDSDTLPAGATTTITTICGIPLAEATDPISCSEATTAIEYSATMYLSYDADATGVSDIMNDVLSDPTAISTLTTAVISDASSSSSLSSEAMTAMSSMTVESFTAAEVEVTSLGQYYPDWVDTKTCTNNGRAPPFIRENSIGYMFDKVEDCCALWFPYQSTCGQSSFAATAEKFFPDRSAGQCGKKPLNEFGAGENSHYDTLLECCDAHFPLELPECCQVDGLGGCNESGELVYFADWKEQSCYSKDKIFVHYWEETWKYNSMQACCDGSYNWDPAGCCESSGGC